MYKIGDKVRIVDLDERYYPPPCFKYLGKIMTIWSIVIEPNVWFLRVSIFAVGI